MATVRFNDKWLQARSTTPDTGRAEYVDELCPGLHLRISYKGTRTFSVVFRINGQLTRHTLGKYPRISIANARAAALDTLRKAQEGLDAREHRARQRSEKTLTYGELVDDYVAKHLKPNARSWKNIRAYLLHRRMQPFLKRRVADISRREIIDLIDGIVAEGVPQAAVNHLRYIKMLWSWAASRDLVAMNPTFGVKSPARTTERDRVLSDDEIVAVWQATFKLPDPYGPMYRMFLLTGQRRTEVATMHRREMTNGTWIIPREKVKKDRAHSVPLTKTAIATLASVINLGPDSYVFSTTSGERPSSNFDKVKRQLQQLSGTSDWTIHDLRRTVRSKLAELRVPEVVARKVMNHELGRIDRTYNIHGYDLEKREALEMWEKRLLALISR